MTELEKNKPSCIGITSKGKIKWFEIEQNGSVCCYSEDLISLELIDGVKELYCSDNKLTELFIPKETKYLDCSDNMLETLTIHSKIVHLNE